MGAQPRRSLDEPPEAATEQGSDWEAPPAALPARRRWARALLWLCLVAALLGLLVAAALALLESDPGRRFIVRAASRQGIDLDYARLRLRPFSGRIELEDLRLAMPPAHRGFAEDWLHLGRLEVLFSPSALVRRQLHVRSLRIEGIRARVLVDEAGRDSLSLWLEDLAGEPDATQPPPAPLSHLLTGVEAPLALHVDDLQVRDVRAELTLPAADGGRRSVLADGLELRGHLRLDTELEGELRLDSPDRRAGTRIRLLHEGDPAGDIDVRLSHRLVAAPSGLVTIAAGAELLQQTLDDRLELTGKLLELQAALRFLPEQEQTRIELSRIDLLDRAVRAALSFDLLDGEALPRVRGGRGALALDPLVDRLPALGDTAIARGVLLTYQVLPPDADAGPRALARLQLRGEAERLRAGWSDAIVDIESAAVKLDADLAEDRLRFALRVPASRVSLNGPDTALDLHEITVAIDAEELRPAAPMSGRLTMQTEVESLTARSPAGIFETAGVRLALSAPVDGDTGSAPSLELALEESRLALTSGEQLRAAPSRWRLAASELTPALERPFRFEGLAEIPRLDLSSAGGEQSVARELRLHLEGRAGREGLSDLQLRMPLASLSIAASGTSAGARNAELVLGLKQAKLDLANPLASRAALTFEARGEDLELYRDALRLKTNRAALSMTGSYGGQTVSSVSGAIELGTLHLAPAAGGGGRLSPGKLTFSLSDLVLDPHRPLLSRAALRGTGRFPPLGLEIEGHLAGGNGEATLRGRLDSLSSLLDHLEIAAPPGLEVEATALALEARGQWRDLGSPAPRLDHRLQATLFAAGIDRPGLKVRFPRTEVVVEHAARASRHRGRLHVQLDPPDINGQPLSAPLTLEAALDADAAAGTGRLETSLEGPDGLTLQAEAEATRSADGLVRHSEQLAFSRLGAVAALIPKAPGEVQALDLATLAVELKGEGTLGHPLAGLRGGAFRQRLRADVRGLGYAAEGLRVTAPDARLELDAGWGDDGVEAEARLHLPRIDCEHPRHHLTLHAVEQRLRLAARAPLAGARWAVSLEGGIQRVEQDLLPAYPLEDLTLSARLWLDALDSFHLERLVLTNPRGGTRLELSKHLTRSRSPASAPGGRGRAPPGSRRLALRGRLLQQLDRIDAAEDRIRLRGRLEAPFEVESGDGSLFRIQANVKLRRARAQLPHLGLLVEGVEADLPVEEALEWSAEDGLTLVPHTERNAFSRVRYQDIQPFLSGDTYLRIQRVRWKDVEAGPVVGSLRIDRNVFTVNKIKIENDDALVSGQLVVDYLPGAERVQFRGNVTGLRSSRSKEPLDANAAVVFHPARLELDGRVNIVRISRKHLLELVDLVDPYREEPSINGLRRALGFGHPRRVSIDLSQGLMSMKVDLGGLVGSFLQVDEIRGVALGPFMSRHVAPLVPDTIQTGASP